MPDGVSIEHEETGNERDSGLSITFSLSVGYSRIRPNTHDKVEARIDSFGLLFVGAIVTVIILVVLVPRILAWVATGGS